MTAQLTDTDLNGLATLPVSVDDLSLSRLQAQPAAGTPLARAAQLTALAWHQRQRNSAAALEMAELASRLLPPEASAVQARLHLVRAETDWLAAQLPLAEQWARRAAAGFAEAQDACGHSDAHAVLGHVLFDQGDLAAARQCMHQARQLAQAAGDGSRDQGALAVLAYWSLVDDTETAEQQWLPVAEALRAAPDPRVAMWANDFFGQWHARHARHSQAIAAFTATSERARDAGQLRRRVVACTNVAACYSNLNDHESAMEWTERALTLARPAGWPASIGLCLMMTGNSLYLLGRLQAARQTLEEAIAVLQPLAGSRTLLVAQHYLLDVLLDLGEAPQATTLAESTLAQARAAGMEDLVCDVQRALAKALLQQGLKREAAAAATDTLQRAERMASTNRVIDALLVLAQVHAPESTPGEPPRASLPHVQRALSLSAGIEGFHTQPDTFELAARELARAGDLEQAYALMRQANAARDRDSALAASHRAEALDVQRETQRLQAEAAALRQEAEAAARRAQALQSTNDTLQQLGEVGREITAQRDLDGIFQRVVQQLQGALELQHLSIWLLDERTAQLQLRYGLERGQRLAPDSVPLHSPDARVAQCARLGQEVWAELPDVQPAAAGELCTQRADGMRTALVGPLRVARRLVGVLCIQSTRPQAYGEHERLVFRSVCAWAAIALDNGAVLGQLDAALRQLQQANEAECQARAQAELATQLKSEFLANISHDLRTPLASLHGYLETLLLNPAQVSEADRTRYLSTALAQSAKVNRLASELMDLAQLESGAMQPTPARFALRDLLADVVRKLELAAARRSQRVLLSLQPELPDAWADPGMIERVLTNLLDNAIQHAPQGSEIRVEVHAEGGQLQLTVLDTGGGIPVELRGGLFSRPSPVAQAHRPGGGGLGLLIVQRLLQQHGCEIRLVERTGYGAAFEFGVPGWRGEVGPGG